jgi:hypothetical protein
VDLESKEWYTLFVVLESLVNYGKDGACIGNRLPGLERRNGGVDPQAPADLGPGRGGGSLALEEGLDLAFDLGMVVEALVGPKGRVCCESCLRSLLASVWSE